MRRELRRLTEEVRAVREEVAPLARIARSAEEEKESALQERSVLQEEHVRLQADLEGERRKADRVAKELETFRLRWWAQPTEPRSGEGGGADARTTR